MSVADRRMLDVAGVGFGPANLALAIALHEHARNSTAGAAPTARFVEQQARFGWHRGMLLDDSTLQVSFLKDLVTMRDPTSDFSFLCYLRAKGRLTDFINHRIFFPSRVEYHDYLEWAAGRLNHLVDYGITARTLRPVLHDGVVRAVEVVADDAHGRRVSYPARAVVLAPGLRPRLPNGVTRSERVWHSSELLGHLDALRADPPRRAVVVGAGQSAAEVTDFLYRTFPEAEVQAVLGRFGYSRSDDNPFANQVFDPATVDAFHAAPQPARDQIVDQHANTNYSVVDLDLIEELYRRAYDEKVRGTRRLHFHRMSTLRAVEAAGRGARVTVQSRLTGRCTTTVADLVVLATGYAPPDLWEMLGDMAAFCLPDPQGPPVVGRDYRVACDESVEARIYLHGSGTEHSHGLSANLLSLTAVRAGELVESLTARRAGYSFASNSSVIRSAIDEMPATTLK